MIWKGLRKLWDRSSPAETPPERGDIVASRAALKWGCVSITGDFRPNNEDRFYADDHGRFFLVADGMGGQSAGEKASELAIELITKGLKQGIDFQNSTAADVVGAIDDAVSHANTEIMVLGELESSCRNMGTTISFIVLVGKVLYVGGIGDSRVYLLRNGELEQLTRDHSLTEALVEAGTISREEAATHRYKNVLYRYLGTKDGGTGTDPRQISPRRGDRFMICSDGVSDGASPERIAELLSKNDDPQRAAEAIVRAAQDGGSKDNITCVVVYVNH